MTTVATHPKLYDRDTFEHRGYTFRVRFERDEFMGEPWKEHDGHGPVSDWTRRAKRPGERILIEDRESRRYYDVAAATKLARKDGWGCQHSRWEGETFVTGHATKGEAIACAVESDFAYLHGWCTDQWEWTSVSVEQLEDGRPTGEGDSLSGIDGDHNNYLTTVAYELAEQIVNRLEVEHPDAVLSEN